MENHSFRNHVLKYFQPVLENNGFFIKESANSQSLNDDFDLLLWVSTKCKIQIFREHNKAFIEIAPLAMRTLNDWYPIYVVVAFLSNANAEDWAWLLKFPDNGFSYEAIDTRLSLWRELVDKHIKQLVSLFEEPTFSKIEPELSRFRKDFYSKLNQLLQK